MKKIIIICSFLSFTILGCFTGYLVYYYNIQQSDLESYKESKNKQNLEQALETAKKNRESLWDANKDENGKIRSQEIVDWIEKKYQDEIDLALKLYN